MSAPSELGGLFSRFQRRSLSKAEAALVGALVTAAPASAAIVSVHIVFEVVEIDEELTAFALGDRFVVDFTYDDSVTDVQPSDITGIFPGLVTDFDMEAKPGNSGTWTPSGTFDFLDQGTFATSAHFDAVTFGIPGSGFPDGGPDLVFDELDLVWDWPTEIVDTGSGDSFAEQLGPLPFQVPPAVFLGNGIVFEFESDPGVPHYAEFADVTTIFASDFDFGGPPCDWSLVVGNPGCD